MDGWKRTFGRIAALCLLGMFLTGIAAAAPAVDDKTMIAAAYKNMQRMNSYHMTLSGDMSMSGAGTELQMEMAGEIDVLAKPLRSRNTMDIAMDMRSESGNNKKVTKRLEQYVVEEKNGIAIYTGTGDQWQKQLLPVGSYDPLKDYENYIRGIKSVTAVSDDTDEAVFDVTISASYMRDTMRKQFAAMGTSNYNQLLSDEFMNSLGDVSYRLTINKNNGTVSKLEMDLSEFTSRIGNELAERMQAPEPKKQEMRDLFNGMKLNMRIEFSQFNSVPPFALPAGVKS